MGFLDRQALLARQELKVERVDLENDDFVYVCEMTGRQRSQWEQSLFTEVVDGKGVITYKRSLDDFYAKLAVNTLCDKDGVALLEPGDYIALSKNIGAARLARIVEVASRLNAITEADKDAIVKNSERGQSGSNISESAANLDSPIQMSGSTS